MYCADVLSVRNRLAEGAAIVVRLVNSTLRGSSSRKVSTFVHPFDTYTEARCSASFLVHSVNNLRLLIRQVSLFVR